MVNLDALQFYEMNTLFASSLFSGLAEGVEGVGRTNFRNGWKVNV